MRNPGGECHCVPSQDKEDDESRFHDRIREPISLLVFCCIRFLLHRRKKSLKTQHIQRMANELERGGGGGGGAGGKLRKTRFTRRENTPYERPQTGRHAPAVVRAAAAAAAESSRRSDNSNGRSWLSRIVDPIISNGARRWFSSVFHKRLAAPPSSDAIAEVQEDTLKEVAEETVENAMVTEEIDQEPILVEKQSEPEAGGLDVLLKDKTLSRDEFNRLIELLETRVVDGSSGMADYEVKTTGQLNGRNTPINAANAEAQRWRDERKKAREEKDKSIRDDGFLFNPSSPVAAQTLRDDAGCTPADIAKAFMGGSHRAPMSTSALRYRPFGDQLTPNRLFRDEQTPNVSNVHQLVPRTESSVFGNGQAEERFKTPHSRLKSSQFARSQNRVQGLSYTPYSRNLQQRVHIEHMDDGSSTPEARRTPIQSPHAGGRQHMDDGSSTLATRWTPIQSPLAGGRQMLKRRSSMLDDGMMSVGPIRRTRHKSNFHIPLRNSNPSCSNGNQLRPSLVPGNDYGQNALASFRKPVQIEKQNDILSSVRTTEDTTKDLSTSLAIVPQQSSETARKILEQLDRMVPSPKEKSIEAKLAIARAKSPTPLTVSMLNGHARRTMETIDSIPICNVHDLDSSPVQENKQSRAQGTSGFEQKHEGKGKSPLLNSVPTTWGASTSSDIGDVALQTLDVSSSKLDKKLEVDSMHAAPEKIKGFRMSAPEESDEEGHANMNATVHSQAGNATFTSHDNIIESKTFKGDKAITSTSTIMTTKAEAHALTSETSVVVQSSINNSSGFSFPVSSVAINFPEPPTPTPMPSPMKKANTQPVEGTSAPTFNFGSENTSRGPVFSFPTSGCTDVDITKPEFGFKFESKPEASFSSTAVAAAASAPALPLQTTFVSLETPAWSFKGSSVSELSGNFTSAPSSSTLFSSTNVATSASSIPLFSGAASKTDGMNSVSFSSPGMSSSTATLANNFGDLTGLKSDSEAKAGILSPMPYLFGPTNVASSASSNTSGASNSTSNLLPSTQADIAGSLFGQASCSAPVTTSAPLLFGSSGVSFSHSTSVPSASLFSTSLSASFGGTSPLLFGSTLSTSASSGSTSLCGQNTCSSGTYGSFPSFGLGSFGTSISTPFGSTLASGSSIASTFGASSNLSSGSSGTAFSGSNAPTFSSSSTPQFGANTSSFGLTPSLLSGLNTNFHVGSNISTSIDSSSSQFGSSSSTSFGSGVGFSSNTTSFTSVPTFSFSSGSASAFSSASTFGSGSSPSFVGSSPSFGSGSIPAFGGSSTSPTSSTPAFGASSASFGSASSTPFGVSGSLFGSGSTPLFGSSSIPQFGLAQSFGASSSTSSSPSTIPSFGSGFGGTPVSASTGFSFGGSSVASGSSFAFGASGNTSSGTPFTFNSVSASPSTLFGSKAASVPSQQSNFGLANASPMFGTAQSSTPTDQMEDSMAEDPAQVTQPVFGGQPASSGPAFGFNSQPNATLPGQNVFQFGAQPPPAVGSPFVAGAQSAFNPSAAGLDFSGGSFSLGAGGEKPGRKFVKVKRDKGRRK